jgi:hypothetical protein
MPLELALQLSEKERVLREFSGLKMMSFDVILQEIAGPQC